MEGAATAAAPDTGEKKEAVPQTEKREADAPEALEMDPAAVALVKRLAASPFHRIVEAEVQARDAAFTFHRDVLVANRKRIYEDARAASGGHSRHSGRDSRRPARFLEGGGSTDANFNGKIRVGVNYQAIVAPFVPGAIELTFGDRERALTGELLAEADSVYVEQRCWSSDELRAVTEVLQRGEAPDFFGAAKQVWGTSVSPMEVVRCYYHHYKTGPGHALEKLVKQWPPPRKRQMKKAKR